jgi:hypothetical protein
MMLRYEHKSDADSNKETSSSVRVHPKQPITSCACLGLFTSANGTPPLETI